MLKRMHGIEVSEATARRQTEGNGAVYVAVQEVEVARLERELPEAPAGPDKQLMSVDGAMVPLVGGEWAEVKTLVLGVIGEPVLEEGEWKVHAREVSYFSRLAEAEAFTRQALVETHRRGVEKAGCVAAVSDGAEWEQGFVDHHRPDAVRILDFPHAGEYLGKIGTAVWGEGKPETQQWLHDRLKGLKRTGPEHLLPELRTLVGNHPEITDLAGWVAYLEKREAHMQYPVFQAQGLPIGSGAVESGNKLVVEARLKGSGMHWARAHVNPMVGLRNTVCNDRWDEAWSQMSGDRQRQIRQRRQVRREQRLTTPLAASSHPPISVVVGTAPLPVPPEPLAAPLAAEQEMASPTPSKRPWRPPSDHPWRKYPACVPRRRSKLIPR